MRFVAQHFAHVNQKLHDLHGLIAISYLASLEPMRYPDHWKEQFRCDMDALAHFRDR